MEQIGGYKRSQSISWREHLIIVGVLIIAILLSGRYLHRLLDQSGKRDCFTARLIAVPPLLPIQISKIRGGIDLSGSPCVGTLSC
jgi:hypothetical protein